MALDILKPILEKVWSTFGDRRKVRFTVHRGFFVSKAKECFFLNLSNLSRNREIEITHIWLDCGQQIPGSSSRPFAAKEVENKNVPASGTVSGGPISSL